MKQIVHALITTFSLATASIFFKKKPNFWFYPAFFLGLLLIDFAFDKLSAEESNSFEHTWNIPNYKVEIETLSSILSRIECLTPLERTKYEKLLKERRFDAERTWNNAKNKCWYLPQKNYRDLSRSAFGVAMAAMGGSTPMSVIVYALLASLTAYGLAAIDEWYYIKEQLQWCQYHCEMVEFYLTVLEKG